MSDPDVVAALLAEVATTFAPLALSLRIDSSGGVVADIIGADGSVAWPTYSRGPDELLATLLAEQRYLVEEKASGSVVGVTYLEKARERLRRALVESTS